MTTDGSFLTRSLDSPQSVVDRACRCKTKISPQAQGSADSELQKALATGLERWPNEVTIDEKTFFYEAVSEIPVDSRIDQGNGRPR